MSNLLIIDDDLSSCAPLVRLLHAAGHKAQCVSGPAEALKHLRDHDLDLVLLDLSMPQIDGFHLLQAMAEEPRFVDVPVAVYSGLGDPTAEAQARRLGARDFLTKGLGWEQLSMRIDALLRDSRQQQSHPA